MHLCMYVHTLMHQKSFCRLSGAGDNKCTWGRRVRLSPTTYHLRMFLLNSTYLLHTHTHTHMIMYYHWYTLLPSNL